MYDKSMQGGTEIQMQPTGPEQKAAIVTATREPAAAGEQERLDKLWTRAVKLVGRQNRALVERGYASQEQVFRDLHPEKGKDYKPTQEELAQAQTEIAPVCKTRRQEQQNVLDPTKIPDDEVKQKAAQMVKSGEIEGKPDDEAVLTAAKQKIIAERQELKTAYDQLYEIDATKQAAEATAKTEIEKERLRCIEEEKQQTLIKLQMQDASKYQKIEDIPPNIIADIEKRHQTLDAQTQEEVRKRVTADYYDEAQGIYYPIRADGEQDKTNPIRHNSTYEPIMQALDKIQASEAQEIRKNLQLVDRPEGGKAFRAKTAKESEAEEAQADLDHMVGEGLKVVGEEMKKSMGDGYEQVFEIDKASGEITGVRQENLEAFYEWLNKQPRNDRITRLTLCLGAYYETPEDSRYRPRIAALIYHELDRTNQQGLQEGLNNKKFFSEEWTAIVNEINQEYGFGLAEGSFTMDNIMEDLFLAKVCEGRLEVDKSGNYVIPEKILRVVEDARKRPLTAEEKHFVIKLANGGKTESLLQSVFGINPEVLTDQGTRDGYAETVVGKVVDELGINVGETTSAEELKRKTEELKSQITEVYRAVADHNLNIDDLGELAKERNFSRGLIYLFLAFGLFSPLIQSVLSTTGGDEHGGSGRTE